MVIAVSVGSILVGVILTCGVLTSTFGYHRPVDRSVMDNVPLASYIHTVRSVHHTIAPSALSLIASWVWAKFGRVVGAIFEVENRDGRCSIAMASALLPQGNWRLSLQRQLWRQVNGAAGAWLPLVRLGIRVR